MKKILLKIVLFTIISGSTFAQTIHDKYQDGKIWFKLKRGQATEACLVQNSYNIPVSDVAVVKVIDKIASVKNLSKPFHAVKNFPALDNVYQLELNDPSKVDMIVELLYTNSSVEYAEKVPLDRPMAAPNDPHYSSQWDMALIHADQAWLYTQMSSNIRVAVVDDAIQMGARNTIHEDLSSVIWNNPIDNTSNGIDEDNNGYIDDMQGFDVSLNKREADPPIAGGSLYFHGTQVAGAVGAATNNNIGVASIGGSRVKIISVKASNSPNTISNGYEGVVYAAVVGANVICMAWGTSVSSITGQNVMNYAHAQGCVLVAAAGNDNTSAMYYPAAYNHVIAVAATQSNDVKASFSNYGSWVDVSAPGVNIYTTSLYTSINAPRYGIASGTSISAGLVAGLAGLMLSSNPGLTPDEVENCIRTSSVPISALNPSYLLGNGRIDAVAAMGCISANQYWIPIADFQANSTNIMRGGKVVFANTTKHDADVYSWSFPGGIPSSAVTTTKTSVEVMYPNTSGPYTVSLVAVRTSTPSPGSDTSIKTSYINVGFGGMCDTTHWRVAGTSWTPRIYYNHPNDTGSSGLYLLGVNKTATKEIAQLFDPPFIQLDKLVKIWIYFGAAGVYNGGSAAGKHIRVKVYDKISSSGNPNAEIYRSPEIPFQRIIDDVNAGRPTEIKFQTPLTIPEDQPGISRIFFISIAMHGDSANGGNLDWTNDRDTLALYSNSVGETNGTDVFHMGTGNAWCLLDNACAGQNGSLVPFDLSTYIFPYLTDQPVNATFTMDNDTICEGNYIIYDATGSTAQDTVSWIFQGGNPSHSNKLIDTVFYVVKPVGAINVYTDTTTLIVRGGGCVDADTVVKTFKVFSAPRITVSASPTSICSGSGFPISATASSNLTLSSPPVWTPAVGLSSSTGTSVIINPTSTQTYEISGTTLAYGCYGSTTLMITVDSTPVAIATVPDSACPGDQVHFNGALSLGGSSNTYSWSMPGATVTSSSSASFTTSYATAGMYTCTLDVTNSCGTDTYVDTIIIACSNIDELFSNSSVKTYYNNNNSSIDLLVLVNNTINNTHINLYNSLGEQIVERKVNLVRGVNTYSIDVGQLARGVYTIQVSDNKTSSYSVKLVIH